MSPQRWLEFGKDMEGSLGRLQAQSIRRDEDDFLELITVAIGPSASATLTWPSP